MKETITVVTVDDHLLVRQGVKGQINDAEGMEVVGEGATGDDAFQLVKQHKPHVLLLDIDMPQSANSREQFQIIAAIRQIKQISPQTAIIILSQHISSPLIQSLLTRGVQGYLLKNDQLTAMLAQAIQTVYYDGIFFSKNIRDRIHSGVFEEAQVITSRQREIILAIAEQPELSYAEQAHFLGITEGTLKNRLREAYKRLGVTNIASCIIECTKRGIIIIDDERKLEHPSS